MDKIDAEFAKTETHTTVPKWVIRFVISFLVSLVVMLLLKPRATLDMSYSAKNMQCELKTNYQMLGWYTAGFTIPVYFAVMKYY